ELFKINFNREGLSWNNRDSSIYDLTRIQPKPYWHVNHLLMRIAHDQEQSVAFVRGNEQEAAKWEHLSGQVEFKDQKIILTTDPNSDSLVVLEDMRPCKDVKVKVNLTGNKYGTQSVYLRTNEELKDAIGVHVSGNNLYVFEDEECLLNLDLNEFEGKEVVSEDEHKKASEVTALAAFARYAPTKAQAEIYGKRMIERQSRSAKSVAEGSKAFVKPIGIHEFGNRKMELCLYDDVLQIKIGEKMVDELIKVKNTQSGKIALQARMGSLGSEQVIYPDDVYDGVFENLKVTDAVLDKEIEPIVDFNIAGYAVKLTNPWEENDDAILYDSKLKGFEGFVHDVSVFWDSILHVFVHGF
ncbi:MAG: hypothetical protein IKK97_07195, partial [Phascolarctobacterium sp.]|nr:hypothetical protein [Phascolarctobacterium sp.]